MVTMNNDVVTLTYNELMPTSSAQATVRPIHEPPPTRRTVRLHTDGDVLTYTADNLTGDATDATTTTAADSIRRRRHTTDACDGGRRTVLARACTHEYSGWSVRARVDRRQTSSYSVSIARFSAFAGRNDDRTREH
jgi:hypothetical protein